MKYENPEMIIVMCKEKDVITTSNLVDTEKPGGDLSDPDDVIEF